MDFWLTVGGIAAFVAALPYIRCFFKRAVLAYKLKALCRKQKYRLWKTHPFWMLGSKHGRRCDCYIETPREVLAIKLFGMTRRGHMLVFTQNGDYLIRKQLILFSNHGGAVRLPFETRRRPLPHYDFRYRYRDAWEIKTPRHILLVHPVCHEIRLESKIIGMGDVVNDLEIYSLSRLMGSLEEGV